MSKIPIFHSIRLISQADDYLNKREGSKGEIFYNKDSDSLTLFNGQQIGGIALAKADLTNITSALFRAKSIDSNLATVVYTVTVTGPQGADSGNKYNLNAVYRSIPNFVVGYTYVFVQNDQTNVYFPNANGTTPNPHPLNFSADNISGERGGGTSYLTDVEYRLDGAVVTQAVYNSTAFNTATARQVQITITNATPATLYYWCWNHVLMGNEIAVAEPGSGSGGGVSVSVADTVPSSPNQGSLWLDTNTGSLYVYYNDGDSEQWIQPAFPFPDISNLATVASLSTVATSGDYDDLTNKPALANVATSGDYDDLTNKPALANVATSGDYDDLTNLPSIPSIGSVTFTGTVVDSADSSNITFTPAINFSSDINVDNDVFVNNTIFTNSINISGVITAQGSGTPEITSDNEILINPGTTTILNGLTTFYQTTEVVNTKTGATGTVVHDFATGSLFLHANIAANFTANIINVPTTNDRSTSVAMIIDQGATPYIPNAVQIDGSAQTIKWSGGSVPSGTANYLDIVNFTLIRSTNSWTVIGSLSTYN